MSSYISSTLQTLFPQLFSQLFQRKWKQSEEYPKLPNTTLAPGPVTLYSVFVSVIMDGIPILQAKTNP